MRATRALALLLGVVVLSSCSGDDGPPAERAATAAAEACAEAEELLTSPSMDRTYPRRLADAADAARRAEDLDERWAPLAAALGDVQQAAEAVVEAAEDPAGGNVRQSEVNAAYRTAQGAAASACEQA